jgi:hypothetical protein
MSPLSIRLTPLPFLAIILCLTVRAPADEGTITASDLAARLSTAVEDGDSATRLRMNIESSKGDEKIVLQLQVKARRTAGKTEVVYQVLWPNDRKGESFLLRQEGTGSPEGFVFTLPDKMTPLGQAQMKDPVLGSDLAYQDVIENFFSWESQSLSGSETVDRVECLILESKPGSKDSTLYGSVRSWIDPVKLVALRVEKYDGSGRLIRRINTDRVAKDDRKRDIPASLIVQRPGGDTVTEIEGSNIRHDVNYTDQDFTTQSLTDFNVPR